MGVKQNACFFSLSSRVMVLNRDRAGDRTRERRSRFLHTLPHLLPGVQAGESRSVVAFVRRYCGRWVRSILLMTGKACRQ